MTRDDYMTKDEFAEFKGALSTATYWVLGLLCTLLGAVLLHAAAALWWASAINTQIRLDKELAESRYEELRSADRDQRQVQQKVSEALVEVSRTESRLTTYLTLKNPDAKDIIQQRD